MIDFIFYVIWILLKSYFIIGLFFLLFFKILELLTNHKIFSKLEEYFIVFLLWPSVFNHFK